jgi:hypothetical protein
MYSLSILLALQLHDFYFLRYFSKPKNSETKGVTDTTDKGSEQTLKTVVQLQNVSHILNTNDSTISLDVESYLADFPNKESLVKSDAVKDPDIQNATNAVSLLTTLDVVGRRQSTDAVTKECLLEGDKSQSSEIAKSCSGNSIKTSTTGTKSLLKSFSWSHNRFGFQKSKSVTSLVRSDAVIKDFKNPFRKTDTPPKDKSVLQVTGRTSVSETVRAPVSVQLPLPVEEEEQLVDDPDSVDSGLGVCSVTSYHQPATSVTIAEVSACFRYSCTLM